MKTPHPSPFPTDGNEGTRTLAECQQMEVRRLGRGLEALLGRRRDESPTVESAHDSAANAAAAGEGLVSLSIYEIDGNPFQPRRDFDDEEMQSLSDSIREHGLLQPIAVRRVGDRYEIIAGERRLRAATKAGFERVPCQVKEADDRRMAELAIVENVQRKDLNPLEKAASFQDYLRRYGGTQEELAARLKINRSTVANLIRLLELPAAVQQAVREGRLSQGHARALLPLGEESEQIALAERVEKEQLSVRAVEEHVRATIHQQDGEPLAVIDEQGNSRPVDLSEQTRRDNLASLEQELRTVLGTQVEVKQAKNGKGKVVIHFATHQEFDRIRGQLHATAGSPRSEAA